MKVIRNGGTLLAAVCWLSTSCRRAGTFSLPMLWCGLKCCLYWLLMPTMLAPTHDHLKKKKKKKRKGEHRHISTVHINNSSAEWYHAPIPIVRLRVVPCRFTWNGWRRTRPCNLTIQQWNARTFEHNFILFFGWVHASQTRLLWI